MGWLMTVIRVIDFETTGLPPGAAICEIGWTDVRVADGAREISDPVSFITDPGRPMPHDARAVHHLSDFDVGGEPRAERILIKLSDGAEIFAAHNAEFEQEFFTGGGRPWICTMKCARRAWPDLPAFGNQFLRYQLEIELDDALAMPPHRAGPDAYVTAQILLKLLEVADVAQLIKWTEMPVYYPRIPMTAHKGKLWSEADVGLLRWFINAEFLTPDMKAAARAELKLRDGDRNGSR
jgi:exodeoxyribonuclease X